MGNGVSQSEGDAITADESVRTERVVATVERAIAVLDVLAASPGELGTNEIARRAGLHVSSASRLLATLARADLVRRADGMGRYRLGHRLIQLGNAALGQVDLREVARPHLIALTEATAETATLSLPGDQTTVTVDFVQSPSSVRSVAQIGRPSVLHATATGKVCLAHGGRLPGGALPSYTAGTLVDRRELSRQVERAAERGWAEAVGEREADLNALAAPVLDGRGGLLAILGLQGPAGRFDRRAMDAAIEPLLAAAAQLSARRG